ncbi:MAG: type I-C CRISPR-associated protein Cas8c/Csd1 [Oscillospiraceae bacterium]
MLGELYQYAVANALTAKPGFKPKKIKCYIMLSSDGAFLGLDPSPTPVVLCPDIGSAANGTMRCNILVEKVQIVLEVIEDEIKDKNISVKHKFFMDALQSGAGDEPLFAVAYRALSEAETLKIILSALVAAKYKLSDPIGIRVDGQPLEQSGRYTKWWNEFRKQFSAPAAEVMPRCFITGELTAGMATVPKVSGLFAVGGHSAGDAFLCFDKDAFQSYGLKQSANAAVSEEAMTAVNAALAYLIGRARRFAGAKLVHWYSGEVQPDIDPLEAAFGDNLPRDEANEDDPDAEREALTAAERLIGSVSRGEIPEKLNARYYIMPLSGANGRMMVRGWQEGSYESLCRNICVWFDDLRLDYGKNSDTRPPKLSALCIRLLKPGGDRTKVWERMDKELAGLLNRMLYAITQNTPLPDEVAARALIWLRSYMVIPSRSDNSDSDGKNSGTKETMVYQLLKAWLRRAQRAEKGVVLMEQKLNPEYPKVAYQCGRLMAVYAAIQSAAMGKDIGAGVLQRYYASASVTPKLVLGKLAALSQHHLAKLENRGMVVFYERMLSEIACHIPENSIPSALNLEQQTEFALGYYQQGAAIYAPDGNNK